MKLTESDDLTIAISKPDGTNYQEILSDVKMYWVMRCLVKKPLPSYLLAMIKIIFNM